MPRKYQKHTKQIPKHKYQKNANKIPKKTGGNNVEKNWRTTLEI